MNYDKFGQSWTDQDELVELLYKNPELDISRFNLLYRDSQQYNQAVEKTYSNIPKVGMYTPLDYKEEVPIELFDSVQQNNWHMPEEYKNLDIAEYILNLCNTQPELQRTGEELLLFQERDLFNLLRYLKYFVDTMRKHNVMWGVGRGSSTASYVLYLLGVHKINSLYYDLQINEFLK